MYILHHYMDYCNSFDTHNHLHNFHYCFDTAHYHFLQNHCIYNKHQNINHQSRNIHYQNHQNQHIQYNFLQVHIHILYSNLLCMTYLKLFHRHRLSCSLLHYIHRYKFLLLHQHKNLHFQINRKIK